MDDFVSPTSIEDEDSGDVVSGPDVLAEVKLPSTIREYLFRLVPISHNFFLERRWTLDKAAELLQQPSFPRLLRKFLYKQLQVHGDTASESLLERAHPRINGKIHVFNSAIATFYAPSDISGITSMRREHIRATPSWRKGQARYDTVLVNSDPEVEGVRGFEVARVFLFFSFRHDDKEYPCALIQWYLHVGSEPDDDSGFWMVKPETDDTGDPHLSIIHLDSIYRAVHLLPAHQNGTFIDRTITMHSSLDTFQLFYINRFADHQSFEVLS